MDEDSAIERKKMLQVLDATRFGVRFILDIDRQMAKVFGGYAFAVLGLVLLAEFLGKTHGYLYLQNVILGVKTLVLPVPVLVWALMKILNKDGGGGYFSLFRWRVTLLVLGASLLRALYVALPVILVMVGTFVELGVNGPAFGYLLHHFSLASLTVPGMSNLAPLLVAGVVSLLFLACYVLLRLAFLSVHVVDKEDLNLREAFRASRDLTGEIFAVLLLSGGLTFLLSWGIHALWQAGGLLDLMYQGPLWRTVPLTVFYQTVHLYFGLMVTVSLGDLYVKTRDAEPKSVS